jgi:hypothetical protein
MKTKKKKKKCSYLKILHYEIFNQKSSETNTSQVKHCAAFRYYFPNGCSNSWNNYSKAELTEFFDFTWCIRVRLLLSNLVLLRSIILLYPVPSSRTKKRFKNLKPSQVKNYRKADFCIAITYYRASLPYCYNTETFATAHLFWKVIYLKRKSQSGGVVQVVKHLPSKYEVLNSNYRAKKKKKKRKKRKSQAQGMV